jgi:ribose transport system ATP-binding protein
MGKNKGVNCVNDKNILVMKNISKKFPGVKALDNVNFYVRKGEIHGLMGENGAGKSTLIKILDGAYTLEKGGEIWFKGKLVQNNSPILSKKLGISTIHQEFNLIPELTVGENIFLYDYPIRRGLIDWKTLFEESRKYLKDIGCDIDPAAKVKTLSVAQQQMVEISSSISQNAELIIMDEPTAPLTKREIDILFKLIRHLKERGITIIYISHNIEEVLTLAERITVLRDGKVVNCISSKELNQNQLIELMVGRSFKNAFPPRKGKPMKEIMLSVRNLSDGHKLKNISFDLKKGEVLGLAGLVGSGRTEILRAVYSADPGISGEIELKGKIINITSPEEAKKNGIGLLPENRKKEGFIPLMSVQHNISLPAIDKIQRFGVVLNKEETKLAENFVKKLDIRTPSLEQLVIRLSGGNQQKVVLAKWLAEGTPIIMLDEPTRGIDVGAKYDIYILIDKLTQEGISVILITSELPELLALSDRILVMHNSRINGEFKKEQFKAEDIMACAFGTIKNGGDMGES